MLWRRYLRIKKNLRKSINLCRSGSKWFFLISVNICKNQRHSKYSLSKSNYDVWGCTVVRVPFFCVLLFSKEEKIEAANSTFNSDSSWKIPNGSHILMRASRVSSEFEDGHHSYHRLSLGQFFEQRSEALGCLGSNDDVVKRVRTFFFLLHFNFESSLNSSHLFSLAFIWLCHHISWEEGTVCINFPLRPVSYSRSSQWHHYTWRSGQNSQPRCAHSIIV